MPPKRSAPDPELPVNCPACGAPLLFVGSNENRFCYLCVRDGPVTLHPDGRVIVEQATSRVDDPCAGPICARLAQTQSRDPVDE